MAWTDIPDKTTGDLMDAVWYGTHFKANMEYLKNVPCAHVYNSNDISIPNALVTRLSFDAERYDTDNIHSTETNTSRLTIPRDGKYLIVGNVCFANGASGARDLKIVLNGTTIIGYLDNYNPTNSYVDVALSTVQALSTNDYVELMVYQTSGAALNVRAITQYSPEFMLHWLGA